MPFAGILNIIHDQLHITDEAFAEEVSKYLKEETEARGKKGKSVSDINGSTVNRWRNGTTPYPVFLPAIINAALSLTTKYLEAKTITEKINEYISLCPAIFEREFIEYIPQIDDIGEYLELVIGKSYQIQKKRKKSRNSRNTNTIEVFTEISPDIAGNFGGAKDTNILETANGSKTNQTLGYFQNFGKRFKICRIKFVFFTIPIILSIIVLSLILFRVNPLSTYINIHDKPLNPDSIVEILSPKDGGVYPNSTVRVEWKKVAGARKYEFTVRDFNTYEKIVGLDDGSNGGSGRGIETYDTYYIIKQKLIPGHHYKIRVFAKDDYGNRSKEAYIEFSIASETTTDSLSSSQSSKVLLGHFRIWQYDNTVRNGDPLSILHVEGTWSSITKGHQLIYIGGKYIIDWEDSTGHYKVRQYDKTVKNGDPLPILDIGNWSTIKKGHQLVYLGTDCILDWEPKTGHYRIWKYDKAVKNGDPLPTLYVQGYWDTIKEGHQLIYLDNDRVLDWESSTGNYRIWQYDRRIMDENPLTAIVVEGNWNKIKGSHQLMYLGSDRVLDWEPSTGHYRIWRYDKTVNNGDPLSVLDVEGSWSSIKEGHQLVYLGNDRVLDWEPITVEKPVSPNSQYKTKDINGVVSGEKIAGKSITISAHCNNAYQIVINIKGPNNIDFTETQQSESFELTYIPPYSGKYEITFCAKEKNFDSQHIETTKVIADDTKTIVVSEGMENIEMGLNELGLNPLKNINDKGKVYTYYSLVKERPLLVRGDNSPKVGLLIDIFNSMGATITNNRTETFYGDKVKAAQQALLLLIGEKIGRDLIDPEGMDPFTWSYLEEFIIDYLNMSENEQFAFKDRFRAYYEDCYKKLTLR